MLKFRILLKSCFTLAATVSLAAAQTFTPPPVKSFPDAAKTVARPASANTPRYATHHRQFTIPFSLVAENQVIVEVALHVSTDRGQRWERHSQLDARQTEFRFNAPQDGEYWFAVQTLNRNGQRVPANIALPELIVVVDTVQPTIEANATTDNVGRVKIEWRARDAFLATDSLVIRYRAANSPEETPWIDVPAKITQTPSGPLLQDSYAFWPSTNELSLELAVSIRDQAGNQATARTNVNRTQLGPQFAPLNADPRGTDQSPSSSASALSQNSPADTPSQPLSGTSAGFRRRTTPSAARSESPQQPQADQFEAENSQQGQPQAVEWRSARHSTSGQTLAKGSTQNLPAPTTGRAIPPLELPPRLETPKYTPPNDQIAEARPAQPNAAPATSAVLVSDRENKPANSDLRSVLSAPPANSDLLGQAISVNSKRFRLNYHVEAIDPSGVKEVAVWATRDGGKNWGRLGAIPDAKGPYPIEVDQSGLYGFRLVVIGQSGIKSRLPQPGDPADKWIRVDVDAPIAKITSAPYGTGEDAGKLVINWEASDEMLALRPIELSYSTRADGPWTTIEKGLRNTGKFVWSVPTDAPDRVFLRLTARDEAGNEANDQTNYAIDISDLYPRGRIQSVEPIRDDR